MSIIYSVVVRQDENGQQMTLCSYDSAQGNYPTITEQILKKIKIQDDISYKFNQGYIYHIKKQNNLLFVCLAENSLKMRTAFAFLQQIRQKFNQKYSEQQIAGAFAYGMNSSFAEIYKQQFTYFNSYKDPDKKQKLNRELEKLQIQWSENIERVLQREQNVEMTVKKAAKLETIAQRTKDRSYRVNRQTFWARNKCKLLVLAALLAAGLIVFLII